MHPTPEENETSRAEELDTSDAGTAADVSHEQTDPDLADSVMQEEYRREYLRQIRQRSCPGCGDDEIV